MFSTSSSCKYLIWWRVLSRSVWTRSSEKTRLLPPGGGFGSWIRSRVLAMRTAIVALGIGWGRLFYDWSWGWGFYDYDLHRNRCFGRLVVVRGAQQVVSVQLVYEPGHPCLLVADPDCHVVVS